MGLREMVGYPDVYLVYPRPRVAIFVRTDLADGSERKGESCVVHTARAKSDYYLGWSEACCVVLDG